MRLQKLGGYASIGLAVQFLVSLGFFVFVLPKLGLASPNDFGDPVKGLAALAASPATFLMLNVVNASFSVTALLLALALRERLRDAPNRMRLAVIAASIAGALFLAGGVVPIVGLPSIASANDVSAYRALTGIASGLVLAGTSAAGWVLVLSGWAALSTGKLPRALGLILILGGVVEILEFAVPLFLILDPFLGTVWSLWLGVTLLQLGSDISANPSWKERTGGA
jgi:hypothetical protein